MTGGDEILAIDELFMAKFPMQLNREFAVIEQGILESQQGILVGRPAPAPQKIDRTNYRLLRISHPLVSDGFASQILDAERTIQTAVCAFMLGIAGIQPGATDLCPVRLQTASDAQCVIEIPLQLSLAEPSDILTAGCAFLLVSLSHRLRG